MKNRYDKALFAALDAAAPDDVSWKAGKDAYDVEIQVGNNVDEALEAALDSAAPDADSWTNGQEAFYTSLDSSKRKTVIWSVVAIFAAILVIIFAIIGLQKPATTPNTTAPTTTTAPAKVDAMQKAQEILEKAGWKPNEYTLKEIDLSKDGSTSGTAGFTNEKIRTSAEMVEFLKSGKDSANALFLKVMEQTGASREELLDSKNWVAVQSTIEFKYPSNTAYKNGLVVDVGPRDGSSGDIFMLFISPTKPDSNVAVRGACANPQKDTPVPPKEPTPTPTTKPTEPTPTPKVTPQPKDPSQDPAPKGNAPIGGGKNQDPGPGAYVAPEAMVTPPAAPRINPTVPVATTAPSPTPTPILTPTPTSTPAIPVGAKPDTAPAPSPEPSAPTPADPATGYAPPPGM